MTKELILSSEADMLLLGRKLGKCLSKGGFIALYGNLGSGKSVLARGIGECLGLENITSPTFTIMQRYDTNPIFYHIDAYRLSGESELFDIGFEECLKRGCLVALEWADLVPGALPNERMDIRISGNGMEPRTIRIECSENVLSEEQFLSL